jgi:hypothetical protein
MKAGIVDFVFEKLNRRIMVHTNVYPSPSQNPVLWRECFFVDVFVCVVFGCVEL